MVKRIFAISMSIILIALLAVSMVGCKGPEEEEAKAIVKDLVSRSVVLNEIYFGKKGMEYRDTGNPNDIYMPVLETEKFVLKSKLVEETRAVFTLTEANSIIDMAFNGVQSEINQNSVLARYMVLADDDWLYINKKYEYPFECLTQYNYDTINITYSSSKFIEATIEGIREENGEIKTVLVEVELALEENGWRLYSSTC